MTREQLQATRAERWRQNGEALLTLEAAQEWLRETGICLFVPRKMQLPAPAPSFVEACLGETNSTPSREAIEAATALLVRLVDAGDAVALNLLGMAGEQPDFLVTPEFLPYIFALRGDRDWKHDPPSSGNGRVSPLVLEVWRTIERTGVQTAVEIRETLGKELTEAAVLRALNELWTGMRVILLPGENGESATWEALKTRFTEAMNAGTGTSLVTALSVLMARYLQTAVAATSEEAEIFLSPLASRSKVREVIRGLSATRQLATYSLDAQPLLYVEGTLPEFGEPVASTDIEALPAAEGAKTGEAAGSKIRKYAGKPVAGPDPLRWKRDSTVPLPPGARRSSTGDSVRDEARGSKPEGEKFAARRKPASDRPSTGRPATGARREGAGTPAEGERKQWTPRGGTSAERPARREGGLGPARRSGARPAGKFAPRRESGAPGESRPSSAGSRPAGSRPGGSRPPFGSRPAFGSRPPTGRGFGARPSGPRATGRLRTDAPSTGRSFDTGSGPGRKTGSSPGGGSVRPRADRPNSRGSSYARPSYGGKGAGRTYSDRPAGDRPSYSKSSRNPSYSKTSGSPSNSEISGSTFGPRRAAGAAPGEGAGSARKGRWVPRTGSGDGRGERPRQESGSREEGGFAGPSGRVSPRGDKGSSRGASSDRTPFSRPAFGSRGAGSRDSAPRTYGARPGAGSRSGSKRPSRPYVKREGGKSGSPGTGAGRPSYTKPWAEGTERPARPAGARPGGARSRPEGTFERKRPAGATGGTPSSGKAGGKTGFKPRAGSTSGRASGGRSAGPRKPGGAGRKRGPGDYPPRKKRPE